MMLVQSLLISERVEGIGEAKPPRDLLFLVAVAGEAGNRHQK